ncbi:protein phosphatase 2c [Artemisia annua]|uniref:Protein phosphatase 2c n=1 Tax=Artemisia annua TaxID=35608 RepID=A0A2U1KKV8_ARTAN|nr:protein phosphatase 2c [Artemisia annua]
MQFTLYFLGDGYLKSWIITEPEVKFSPRAREDECLILASDVLWDVMFMRKHVKLLENGSLFGTKGIVECPLKGSKDNTSSGQFNNACVTKRKQRQHICDSGGP